MQQKDLNHSKGRVAEIQYLSNKLELQEDEADRAKN